MTVSAGDDIVLAVEKSVTGRVWRQRPAENRFVQAIAQSYGLPEIVSRVIVGRGIGLDEAPLFLNPTLRDCLPNPSIFQDMDKACERLASAIRNKESVAVFGDYDVDGATSSALFKRFFRTLGQDITVYIPDRMKEGYGPNAPALLGLREQGVDLVVTVDCGIVSHEPLKAAQEAGLEVIVVDHHQAEPQLPPAVAVVNPNRLDESGEYGQLAAVGVSFLVLVGLNRELRRSGWYAEQGLDEPNIMELLDLVALGTICDVVPLTTINRALVTQGLKVLAGRKNAGIRALSDITAIKETPGTYHAGFLLGPRVNAGGRVGRAEAGVLLLSTEDDMEARDIAAELHHYNAERQAIEQMVLEEATAQVAASIGPAGEIPPVIVAAGEGWHEGVIGIVAGRIKEEYQRPTFVIAIDKDGKAKGSGRSIAGVDLGAAVTAARQAEIINAGGGHAMAAGLSMEGAAIDTFTDFLRERLGDKVEEAIATLSLKLDGVLSLSAISSELVDKLDRVGPYGQGNAQPRFAFAAVTVTYADVVGKDHVKCSFKGADGAVVRGMAFRSADKPLGQLILAARGKRLNLAGTVRNNHWNGRVTAEIYIEDAAACDI